jgi:O-antigen ligase
MLFRRFESWVVVVATILIPLAFIRVVRDSFDVTKATLVAMTGALLVPFAIMELWKGIQRRRISLPGIGTIVFLVLCVASLFVSRNPWSSFFGQYQRYTGLLTIVSCLAVAVVIARRLGQREVTSLATVLVSVQILLNFYGWLQAENRDPFEWTSQSFGRFVFSTLGNPNTASAFSVITLPLAVHLVSRARSSRALGYLGMVTFASTVYLIPVYDSFQAYVGLVPLVGAIWLLMRSWNFQLSGYGVASVLLLQVLVFLAVEESTALLLIVLALSGAVLELLIRHGDDSKLLVRRYQPKLVPIFVTSGIGLGAVTVLYFDTIRREIDNGLLERKYFYQAAWDLWREAPILGRGLETFGAYYSQYRPEEHATSLEYSITSSVHSIPLGMFASGGVLLGFAYLFMMGSIAWFGVRQSLINRSDPNDIRPWLLVSFAAFTTISLVSVESIHLYFLAAVILGAVAHSPSAASEPTNKRARRTVRQKQSQAENYLVLVSLVIWLVTLPISTRFFRADKAAIDGMKAAVGQDAGGAFRNLERANDLAWWEPSFAIQFAQALAANGNLDLAAEEALKAAELSNYVGSASPSMALIVLQAGRLEEGLEVLEKAITNDPFAPELKRTSADLYRQVADVEDSQGQTDLAQKHRARAEELLALSESL